MDTQLVENPGGFVPPVRSTPRPRCQWPTSMSTSRRLDGDEALAPEIEERLALYAVGEAWVAPGVGDEGE